MRQQYRTEAQAANAGQQTARRVMYGLGDNKHFPDTFAANLASYINRAKESAARVAHDVMLTAYWQAQIAELEAAQQRENMKAWSIEDLEEAGYGLVEGIKDARADGNPARARKLRAELDAVTAEWTRRRATDTAEDRYARGIGPAVPAVNAVVRGIW